MYFKCATPKYPPKHPILNHPKPTLLPQYERPSFTPIQYKRQTCSFIYLNLYIFGQQTDNSLSYVNTKWDNDCSLFYCNVCVWQ